MSYYKTISGEKMDGAILDTAEQAAKGAGDGRISQADAVRIFQVSKDANKITDVDHYAGLCLS